MKYGTFYRSIEVLACHDQLQIAQNEQDLGGICKSWQASPRANNRMVASVFRQLSDVVRKLQRDFHNDRFAS
jgi:hypothetical protein